jgi:hypothetical protein
MSGFQAVGDNYNAGRHRVFNCEQIFPQHGWRENGALP